MNLKEILRLAYIEYAQENRREAEQTIALQFEAIKDEHSD